MKLFNQKKENFEECAFFVVDKIASTPLHLFKTLNKSIINVQISIKIINFSLNPMSDIKRH